MVAVKSPWRWATTAFSRVVDIKTPGSGEVARTRWENLPLLGRNDQLKFVLCDRADYDWARERIVPSSNA